MSCIRSFLNNHRNSYCCLPSLSFLRSRGNNSFCGYWFNREKDTRIKKIKIKRFKDHVSFFVKNMKSVPELEIEMQHVTINCSGLSNKLGFQAKACDSVSANSDFLKCLLRPHFRRTGIAVCPCLYMVASILFFF